MKSIKQKDLIKGRWYVYANNYFIKFDRLVHGSTKCSEYISDSLTYYDNGGNCTQDGYLEADMSIVTKYLPDNHPDKVNYYEIY